MPDMREEFEAHAKVRWSTDYDGFGDGLFSIQADGRYEYEHIQWDWETWKASRAALRVELPEVGSAPHGGSSRHWRQPGRATRSDRACASIRSPAMGLLVLTAR